MSRHTVGTIPPFSGDGTRSTKHERILAVKVDALPETFRQNSLKESLVLEYVENFRRQFVQLYPERPALLLSPKNEAGVSKFVCTTVRPTQLPLKDLYDMGPCAKFLAKYMRYEPLDPPDAVPAYLPSPYFTLQTRAGDSFDFATVLASYLIGSGYDAYVVSGTAPAWVALKLEDRSVCQWNAPPDAVDRDRHALPEALGLVSKKSDTVEPVGVSRYRLPPPPPTTSEFLKIAAAKADSESKAKAEQDKYESDEETPEAELVRLRSSSLPVPQQPSAPRSGVTFASHTEDDDESSAAGVAKVHAWVLVRAGPRDVTEHVFIEPSTGTIYPVNNSPYLSIQSSWNNTNYYVNMQSQPLLPTQPTGDISQLSDLLQSSLAVSGAQSGRSTPGGLLRKGRSTAHTGLPGGISKMAAPYAARVGGKLDGAPALDSHAFAAAMEKRPPLTGELTHRPDGGHIPSAHSSRSPSRSGRRTASRSASRGPKPSSATWRKELGSAQAALQRQVVDLLVDQAHPFDLKTISFDFLNEDEWEFVMIPSQTAPKPDEAAGFAGSDLRAMSSITSQDPREDGKEDFKQEDGDGSIATEPSMSLPSGIQMEKSKPQASLEKDGEHILDLPQSWVPRLILDRYVAKDALGASNKHVTYFYRSRLETYVPHAQPQGLITRFIEFHDTSCIRMKRVTEVFSRRKDGLYKRVRHVDLQCVEQHFEKDHFGGMALLIDVLGKRQELYFYPGARIDGLLQRVHEYGVKITEIYGDTPNRLWYRALSLAQPGASRPTLNAKAIEPISTLTVEVAPPVAQEVAEDEAGKKIVMDKIGKAKTVYIPVEQAIRKMTEKYRRDPTDATPAHVDIAKVVYFLDHNAIQVHFHHAVGRITAGVRMYQKPMGKYEQLTVDPYAPAPRPFDIDEEFRKLCIMEKECHAAARARARACLEILTQRILNEQGNDLEKTIFEIAVERARTGAPLEDEPEKRVETDEIDYLLPFLLAAKCADPNNPTEKEARKADRECRLAYKERLLERVAIIQKRLEAENDDLLRRQQAFSRNRDHAEGAEEEFERYCAEATFRIGILEQRLERQEALVTKKFAELEQKLISDPRLAIIHNPVALAARTAKASQAKAETKEATKTPARSGTRALK